MLECRVQRTAYEVETFCFSPRSGVDLRRDGAEQYLGFVSSHHTVHSPADRKVEGEGRACWSGWSRPPSRYERKSKSRLVKGRPPENHSRHCLLSPLNGPVAAKCFPKPTETARGIQSHILDSSMSSTVHCLNCFLK